MPILGLGTWLLTRNTAATVEFALELGYSHKRVHATFASQQFKKQRVYVGD